MENTLRRQIVETGLKLLEQGLVARTWGNVSAKADGTHLLITPSGLDYTRITPEDLALYNYKEGTYEGHYKPSSEKGIHASAYEIFPEAGFVIHTHQNFASAIGVCGFETLDITKEERELLGEIGLASYGLPGTNKLKNAVKGCFLKGQHTVLMKHHGTVVVGKDREEAWMRVNLLEEICRRNYKGHDLKEKASEVYARLEIPLVAQLDDMAQMIGRKIPVITGDKEKALESCPAIFVPGEGGFVKGIDEDDTEALEILMEKAATTALQLRYYQKKGNLSWFDSTLMHQVYVRKYSKKKRGV